MPFLAILGLEPEMMGWGTTPDDIRPFLPPGGELIGLEGVGHFVHIEQPDRVFALVRDFLAA
jgi:pimeloyl-ACP methyl ester carboxylesterase